MQKKGIIALLLAVLMIVSLAACNGGSTSSTSEPAPASSSEAPADSSEAPAEGSETPADSSEETPAATGAISYPMETEASIRYWKPISGDLIRKEGISSDNQTKFAENLQALTGVKIEFVNPPVNTDQEQFNLLLASGDMPDIMEIDWLRKYPAGPDDAIAKGLVYDFTDQINELAPDFLSTIQGIEGLEKKFKTDGGRFWGMGMIRETPLMGVWRGPVIRTDLLEELGLDKPETIEEWDTTLRAFKDAGVEVPLTFAGGNAGAINELLEYGLFCAWGAKPGIYLDDAGKMVYGPIEAGFKDTLLLLRGWYADGLLDKNSFTNTNTEYNALMGGGRAGATNGNTGGGIGAWTPVLEENVEGGKLEATLYPTQNKGERAKFGQKEPNFYEAYIVACVNPKSAYVEDCVKLLNYGYTDEGNIFYNYGLEGESWEGYTAEGYPDMMDAVDKAPDNKAEWSYYARSPYNGPMVQNEGYIRQLLVLPTQVEAMEIWDQTDMDKYQLPPVTQSVDEGKEYSKIYQGVEDYYKEFTAKYILGEVPEDAFENEFVPTVQGMDIQTCLDLRQAALDRYNAR